MPARICNEESRITRRTFCNRVAIASSALALGTITVRAQARVQNVSLIAYPPMKIDGAETLAPGGFLYFNYPTGRDAAVLTRSAAGEYFAFSRKCAHLGCSVEFDHARACLLCPCHKGSYDTQSGMVIFGPPPRPLDPIVLQMRSGGQVWAVGKRIGSSSPNA